MAKTPKKPNPADLTRRNLLKTRRDIANLNEFCATLAYRIGVLEQALDNPVTAIKARAKRHAT